MSNTLAPSFTIDIPQTKSTKENLTALNIVQSEIDSKPEQSISVACWGAMGPGVYTGMSGSSSKLPAGVYSMFKTNAGIMLKEAPIASDELLLSPDNVGYKLVKEIEEFWGLKALFSKYGFLHRRGYLLSGPPGCGKTCIIKMVAESCIKEDAVMLSVHVYTMEYLVGAIKMIRGIEPTRKIICIFEDVDEFGEFDLLSYLDGEDSVDGVVNIATTNHIEDLPPRLIARPRRFDRILKVTFPSTGLRKKYYKSKVPDITDDVLDELVSASEEFSFAAMADLIVSVFCLGKTITDSAASLKTLQSIQTF